MTFHINEKPSDLRSKQSTKLSSKAKTKNISPKSSYPKRIRRNTRNLLLF